MEQASRTTGPAPRMSQTASLTCQRAVRFDLDGTVYHHTDTRHETKQKEVSDTELAYYDAIEDCEEPCHSESRLVCVWQQERQHSYGARAIQAVLMEQKRQRQEKIEDSDLLAIIYEGYVGMSRREALRQGSLDEVAASDIVEHTTFLVGQSCAQEARRGYKTERCMAVEWESDDDISVLSDCFEIE